MCSVPPPPPPLPDPEYTLLNTKSKKLYDINNKIACGSELCKWAEDYPELRDACLKNDICLNEAPFQFRYKNFDSIQQEGPTCGLVALSMLLSGIITPAEILKIAKAEEYTNRGEMFSCKNMVNLAKKTSVVANVEMNITLRNGNLYSDYVIEKLLNGSVILVPYDADFNHSPCLKQGHKAHWGLICGVLVIKKPSSDTYTSDPSNVYALCKHGKSKYLAIWTLDIIDKSNGNLLEFSQKRSKDGPIYVLPEGGVGGENGLKDQYIIVD